jgi:voltage-gated potassium channel
VYTARYLCEDGPEWKAILQYVFSFTGIVDLLSFLPYYLPFFFPEGAIAFRMFRVVRIFRLFRINAYYDSLNVITEVIVSKKQQLLSSVFIVVILMVASSLCMYSLEHDAQPDVFENAFSGIWWAASTLMTVGYGDIYPVTTAGRLLGIIITFLGAGMIAIPTGIISAGFVEQYAKIQKTSELGREMDVSFIKVRLGNRDKWSGSSIKDLGLPSGMVVAAIRRDDIVVVPSPDTVLASGDSLVVAAEGHKENVDIDLKSIVLAGQHPFIGRRIRDLDISRQTYIVMIKRDGRIINPRGDSLLEEGDELVLYTRKFIPEATTISV